jgi:hypothetical protein
VPSSAAAMYGRPTIKTRSTAGRFLDVRQWIHDISGKKKIIKSKWEKLIYKADAVKIYFVIGSGSFDVLLLNV